MLVRIPSGATHIGPFMPDREVAEDALQGLGEFGEVNPLSDTVRSFLIAQGISVATIIAAEIIASGNKSATTQRILHAVVALTTGYSSYQSYNLTSVAAKLNNPYGTVGGGFLMTIDGLMAIGNGLAVFGKVEPGKKYKLVTATQSLKKVTPAAVPV